MTAPFIDTNVLAYLLTSDTARIARAKAILAGGGIVSVQVLNELANVARRKSRLAMPELRSFLATIRGLVTVVPVTLAVHDLGLDICARYGVSLYDSMLLAAAVQAGCDTFWTEDMQPGMCVLETLVLQNPFR
jgi:predicted nucleic acid-binding protein